MKQVCYLLITIILFACNATKTKPSINIAVAANMQYAMEELVEKFESNYHIKVKYSSSSSGILTTQIRNGAPFDIFISANMKYPNILFEEGLTTTKPIIYAYGTLIIWSMEPQVDLSNGLDGLTSSDIETIAIANTEIAPYGIAAIEALSNAHLYDSISSKIIIGESIGQVNQYIQSKAVHVGLTSKSVLFSPNVTKKGKSIHVDKTLYTPINQGIVMLKNTDPEVQKNSKLFYDFMLSEVAAETLIQFGYDVD